MVAGAVQVLIGVLFMLSKETILDLQKIILEEFGQKLDFFEVSKIASQLIRFIETLSEINKSKN